MKIKAAFLFVMLLASSQVRAEEVAISSDYPSTYGDYRWIKADSLGTRDEYAGYCSGCSSESVVAIGGPSQAVTADIYGDIELLPTTAQAAYSLGILSMSRYNSGSNYMVPDFFRVAPGKGPYGEDAFRVTQYNFGQPHVDKFGVITIGAAPSAGSFFYRLKVHPDIAAKAFYSSFYHDYLPADPARGRYVYLEGEYDSTQGGDTGKRGCIGTRQFSVSSTDMSNVTYAPMVIYGNEVHLGVTGSSISGTTSYVLVGTNSPITSGSPSPVVAGSPAPSPNPSPSGSPNCQLQVSGTARATSLLTFSSREYKTDVRPLTPMDYKDILAKVDKMDLYRYKYKSAPTEERLGIIAEEAPTEILNSDGSTMSLSDSAGFFTAALKELKNRNDQLKARLEALEKIKASRAT